MKDKFFALAINAAALKYYKEVFSSITSEAKAIEKALYDSDNSQFHKFVDMDKSIHSYKCLNFKIDFFKDQKNILNVFLEPFDKVYDYSMLLNTLKEKIKSQTKYYLVKKDDKEFSSIFIGEIIPEFSEHCIFPLQFLRFVINNFNKIIQIRTIETEILLKLSTTISKPEQYFEELLNQTWAKQQASVNG